MDLRAVQEALAEHAARAQRDLGLGDMEAGAQRVRRRIEEGQQPRLLVGLEAIGPDQRHGGRRGDSDQGEFPPADPGQEEDDAGDGDQDDRRSEIGLLEDERGRDHEQQQGRHQRPDPADMLEADGVEIAGQHEHQGDLHDLRRLEPERAEIDPALGAAAFDAAELGGQQQQDRQAPHPVGQAVPEPRRDRRGHDHDQQRHAEPPHLGRGPGEELAACRRIEQDEADRGGETDRQGEPPVDEAEAAEDRGPFLCKVHRPHRGTCIIGSGGPGGPPGRAAGRRGPARPVRRCRCSVSGS